jgi:hypothetical protein
VILILVVVAGVVKVPGLVNTVMFEKPPAAAAAEVHVEPSDLSMLPLEPGATKVTALVPLPKITLLAVSVAAPVPPAVTAVTPPGPVITVPLVAGNVNTVVPATAGACKVTDPLVSPDMTTLLIIYSSLFYSY